MFLLRRLRREVLSIPAGEIFALETNTLPGMTSASLIPKEAAAEGMSFIELLETLLDYAVRLHKKD